MASSAGFLAPLLSPDRCCQLRKAPSGAVLATGISTAFDSSARRRGLLGRDGLADGEALVIAPCSAIHTFGMRFPIDVVFADREGRIVGVREHVRPRRIAAAWRAFAAIELAAGAVSASGLKKGDTLEVAAAGA